MNLIHVEPWKLSTENEVSDGAQRRWFYNDAVLSCVSLSALLIHSSVRP